MRSVLTMDADYESNLGESSESSRYGCTIDNSAIYNSSLHVLAATCAFCRILLPSDNNNTSNLDSISVCGDCKFLFLDDFEATSPDMCPRRLSRRMHGRSESIEGIFSQQFSQLVNLARHNQSTFSEHDYQSVDGDARLVLYTRSSRTTPSGSRRWRVFSDTESDGFDSQYDESELNISFRRHSYSAYGGQSADGQFFMENENFGDLERDSDVDPMNAGYLWNSEDDSEWEEADFERYNALESLGGGDHHVRGLSRLNVDLLTNLEEPETRNYVRESGGHHDARGFENFGERLVETESLRSGAPPASISFINNMPCITINEDELESKACAICKEPFTVGTIVNQLPCFHLFHPSCILPWLSTRNTCPLCRHELPTDVKDYEARKRNVGGNEFDARRMLPRDVNYDAVMDEPSRFRHDGEQGQVDNADSVGNGVARDVMRNKWFFLAAPIIGIVGTTLMLCFANLSRDRRCRISQHSENSQRRWWSFF